MFRAIVFDFDGLLMDTETPMLSAWTAEWAHHGLQLDHSSFWADHGGDMTEPRYAALAAAAGPGFDRDASDVRRKAHRDALLATTGLRDGIAGWLASAPPLRLAVASSSPRSWVLPHLARAGVLEAFEVVACGDEVQAPKPDPGVYLLALERLGVPPGEAVAVEDAPHGVTAAQAAGMRCIAIPSQHARPGAFGHADLVVGSAAESSLAACLAALTAV